MSYRSSAVDYNTAGSVVSPALPAGTIIGDAITLIICGNSDNAPLITWPSGFVTTEIAANLAANFDGQSYVFAATKAYAGEAGPFVITTSTAGSIGGIAISSAGRSGAATHVPSNGALDGHGGGATVTVPLNGVLAAANDDVLWIGMCAHGGAGTVAFTAPSGYTSRATATNAAGNSSVNVSTKDAVSAGATGALSGSFVAPTGGGDSLGLVLSLAATPVPSVATSAWLRA